MPIEQFEAMPLGPEPGGGGAPSPGPILTAMTVEKPVLPLDGNPAPRYPTMLARAGVEGEVLLQFVVDTVGAVEPGSIHSIRATQPQFESAVREALVRARFVPAEYGGHRVRQLVEQSFTFAITRR
jgi:periplasmic protein TonB